MSKIRKDIDFDAIDSMKYNELRSLAKEVGIKANMKFDRLREAIKNYYGSKKPEEDSVPEESDHAKTEPQETDKDCVEEEKPAPKRKTRAKGGRKVNKRKAAAVKGKKVEETPDKVQVFPQKTVTPSSLTKPVFAPTYSRSDKKKHAVLGSSFKPAVASPLASPAFSKINKTPKFISSKPATPTLSANKTKTHIKEKTVTARNTPNQKTPSRTPQSQVKRLSAGRTKKKTPTPSRKSPRFSSAKSTPKETNGSEKKASKRKLSQNATTPKNINNESPASERPKRARKGTYEVDIDNMATSEPTREKSSPDANEVVSSLTSNMSSAQMKETILNALDKKVQQKMEKRPEKTQIPRFAAFVAKQKEEKKLAAAADKTKTPDWKKIHKRHFGKMDSLDDYLEKRRQRTMSITASMSKAKMTADRARATLHSIKTTNSVGAKIPKSRTDLFRGTPHKGVPFVPSVMSTSKMNLNFCAVKSPRISKPVIFTGQKETEKGNQESVKESKENIELRKSVGTRRSLPKAGNSKTIGTQNSKTPAKADTTISHSPTKKFNLQASLARPITWKPYTGKIKNQYTTSPGGGANKSHIDIKAPKLQTRTDRRQAHLKNRENKKNLAQMKRRGLAA